MKIRFLIVWLAVFNQYCFAQSQQDPDWPCVQVLVPEISAASIWDGPSIDELENEEAFRKQAKALMFNVIEKHEPLTESQIDEYTAQFQADQHNLALTSLFKSFLQNYNNKRKAQIDTIKRYTRSQIKSAKIIENLMDQKADLEALENVTQQIEELDSKLHWQKRMFKERERAFISFCELPQEIAQQAGEVARMISAKLDY